MPKSTPNQTRPQGARTKSSPSVVAEIEAIRAEVRELAETVTAIREQAAQESTVQIAGVRIAVQVARDLSQAEDLVGMVGEMVEGVARRAHDAFLGLRAETTALPCGSEAETEVIRALGASRIETRLRYLGHLLLNVADQTIEEWDAVDSTSRAPLS